MEGGPRQLEGGHHQLDPPHVGHRADLVGAGGASGPGPGGEGGLVDVGVVFTREIFIISNQNNVRRIIQHQHQNI